MMGLTPNQARALAVIKAGLAANGKAPTCAQIAAQCGWSAQSTAWYVIESLIARGHVRRTRYGLELTWRAPCYIRRNRLGLVVQAEPLQFIPLRNIRPLNLKQIARAG